MSKLKISEGDVVGKLTIVSNAGVNPRGQKWECWCSKCGWHSIVFEEDVLNQKTECCQ